MNAIRAESPFGVLETVDIKLSIAARRAEVEPVIVTQEVLLLVGDAFALLNRVKERFQGQTSQLVLTAFYKLRLFLSTTGPRDRDKQVRFLHEARSALRRAIRNLQFAKSYGVRVSMNTKTVLKIALKYRQKSNPGYQELREFCNNANTFMVRTGNMKESALTDPATVTQLVTKGVYIAREAARLSRSFVGDKAEYEQREIRRRGSEAIDALRQLRAGNPGAWQDARSSLRSIAAICNNNMMSMSAN